MQKKLKSSKIDHSGALYMYNVHTYNSEADLQVLEKWYPPFWYLG